MKTVESLNQKLNTQEFTHQIITDEMGNKAFIGVAFKNDPDNTTFTLYYGRSKMLCEFYKTVNSDGALTTHMLSQQRLNAAEFKKLETRIVMDKFLKSSTVVNGIEMFEI